MLIIAIPKSASTSLMITLGKIHGVKSMQDFTLKENKIPEKSKVIHTVHSDIREILQENVNQFNQEEIFYKQHIFPSDNNLKRLETIKKVVLIRDPKDILYAYLRGAKKKHNGLPKGYLYNELTRKKILKRAKNDGFFDDICFFRNQWKEKANLAYTLFIDYVDYVQNTKEVINKIEVFFNLPITSKEITPVKARYSKGRNRLQKYLIQIIVYFLEKAKLKAHVKKLFT